MLGPLQTGLVAAPCPDVSGLSRGTPNSSSMPHAARQNSGPHRLSGACGGGRVRGREGGCAWESEAAGSGEREGNIHLALDLGMGEARGFG